MKLSKANKRRIKAELKTLKVKGGWLDETQFTNMLLHGLKQEKNEHHNVFVAIAKGVLGLDEAVEPVIRQRQMNVEDFLA